MCKQRSSEVCELWKKLKIHRDSGRRMVKKRGENLKKPTHQPSKIAAVSTHTAHQNAERTDLNLSEVKGRAKEMEQDSDSKGSSEKESAEVVEDTAAIFEALEKPEMLNLREETASAKRKATQMKKSNKMRQKSEKIMSEGEVLIDRIDFDKVEKPEEISKNEQMKTQESLRPKSRKRAVDVMRTQDETEEEKKPQFPSHLSVLRAMQSIKDTVMDFSAHPEPGARKSTSVPAISSYRRSSDPPVCHYKFVTVRVQTIDDLELTITENLVVLFIPFSSPAFYDLVIGDQIVECDGVVPKSLQEFNDYVTIAEKVVLGIVRAWNVHPPSPKRMNNVLPHKKYCYLIVDLPLLTGMRLGYEFRCSNGRLYLTKLEPQTMGAFAFLAVDRIIDVDSDKIPPRVNMVALRNRIRAVQERDGFCTFLVERPSSLHHVTNPSCAAMKPAGTPADGIIMGDDAIEIGAREAFKYARVKNKLRFEPVYTMKSPLQSAVELDLITAVEDSEAASRRRRKRRRRLRIGKNPREKAIPSDVKRGTALSKASDNTIRKLVTKFISKTFSH
ncbi:unnamed protein product [Cylicocyclus nassatus]|uniref:PDZ domain-containing protein n=1 Tax=Cylicocyclus nassatus TaxID=53992 RepID=A0AA36MDN0_CYLNA|nr:unnamed protein product [Cylicocyclus nassatus]